MVRCPRAILAAVLLLTTASAVMADVTVDELKTTVEALKTRLQDADSRIRELEDQQKAKLDQQDVAEICKKMMSNAQGGPGWASDLTFYGDLRLRYEQVCFTDGADGKSRGRPRFRLRFGFKKYFLDKDMEVGFRIASGSSDDPTSTNQTFDDNFSEKDIWIDRAYAAYSPSAVDGLLVIAGKMPNPFRSTNVVWDSDVNPEGAYVEYQAKQLGAFRPFGGIGYFLAEETSDYQDTFFMAYVLGFDWAVADGVETSFAATLYDWEDVEDDFASKAAAGDARGNTTGWDVDFYLINLYADVSWKMFDLPWKVFGEWTHNCAKDPSLSQDQQDAYAIGFAVGKAKKAGTWAAGYRYAYIEPNAVFGYFSDSDFGYANRKGHELKFAYAVTDFLTAGVNLFFTEPVALVDEDCEFKIQADLIWKF